MDINEIIGTDELYQYMTGRFGQSLAIYNDGVYLVESNAVEIDPEERAIVEIRCPGTSNLDMTRYREDWDCDHLTDEEVLRECCDTGDMCDELDSLRWELAEALKHG